MQTEALQRHRINRVINFVRKHEYEALTLENLADVACLSRYHFSRIFANQCQETPIEFVSRMRLEQSVSNLIYFPGMSITSIASEAGFSSSQAFSNAFHRRFGIAPRNFRVKNRWYVKDFPKNQYVLSPLMSKLPASALHWSRDREVVLWHMPATRLAYIRQRRPYYYSSEGGNAAFTKLIEWAKIRGVLREDTAIIGVCPDNPAVTPPHFCQYDVGISVEDGVDEDDIVSVQNLPATTLATLDVTGSMLVAKEAWRWLISHWLPRSGMSVASHVYYEVFKSGAVSPQGAVSQGLLCMPVSIDNPSFATDRPSTRIPSVQNHSPNGINHNLIPNHR